MSALHPMLVKAARTLCDRGADQCGVDREDSWKTYGDDYLKDAEAVLSACGAHDLLEALRALLAVAPYHAPGAAHGVIGAEERHASAIKAARAAIAKAEGKE